jgi:hypothetical protein
MARKHSNSVDRRDTPIGVDDDDDDDDRVGKTDRLLD